ncbi:D-alanyl-D-alanine carboxypeptidase family protein [Thiohalorhabdus sp. Cl-TMA]|uniref:serine-type D-Ala-D-Ala carboxypeptidase n=1 Tax=Thiohalorhabdus methylotrophus TaxID=3242694 RepID=A0ABV4TXR2_9GAMM
MKNPPFLLLRPMILLLALLLAAPVSGAPVPSPPEVDGHSAFLMDYHSGRVLADQEGDKPWPPASLAKLMTLYTAFTALEEGSVALDDTVRVSEKAWRTKGSRMFLEVGDEVPLKRILKGIIVESGNDACVALAEHVAGSEEAFVQLMNMHGRELGMENTQFANATGLPAEGMKTTARDMAHLAAALIREFSGHYDLFSIRKMTYNEITQYNRNRLMWWDDSVDGMKTGHTEDAGYALVASAKREGMRLISVVMGTGSERARAEESQTLLNYGFRFYRTYKLYNAGESLHEVRVWKGAADHVGVSLPKDLYLTLPRGQRDRLEVTLNFGGPLMAPVPEGTEVGQLVAKLEDRTVTTRPLTTLQEIPEGGFFGRLIDSFRVWLTE